MDLKRCRLTEKQQDRLAEFFVAGVTARTAADLLGVNRKTAAYFYHRLRQIIAQEVEGSSPFAGHIEVDESYFGGYRKGKRGRGAAGKLPVFGLLTLEAGGRRRFIDGERQVIGEPWRITGDGALAFFRSNSSDKTKQIV